MRTRSLKQPTGDAHTRAWSGASGHHDVGEQLARCHVLNGKATEAELKYRQALETRTKLVGEEHPSTSILIKNLGECLTAMRWLSGAEFMLRTAVSLHTKVLGADYPNALKSSFSLAECIKA